MDSDGSHIIIGGVICVALIAMRAFYTCCETACTEISDGKVKSFENEKGRKGMLYKLLEKHYKLMSAFSAHRILNAVMLTLALEWTFIESFMRMRRADVQENGALYAFDWYSAAYTAAIIFVAVIAAVSLGDGLPRRLIRGSKAEKFAVATVPAVNLLYGVMKPFTLLSDLISGGISRLLGLESSDDGDSVTEEEILFMVDAGNETGSIESSEREMINNVFEFHDMTVSDVMTHRTDMVAVDIDAEISEVVYTAINSGFSRIPVYRESVDRIEGIIYVKDLLCLIGTPSADGVTVKSFLRDAEFVPESCMCDDLFKKLTARKLQLAVVVDEYGGTAGLVTMEDLVEAIVGNIQDEYDNEAEEITRISEDVYTISGNADAANTMETLGCPLPEDCQYDTMSGFVTDLLGHIPEDGENPSVAYRNIVFTVLLSEDMRIVKIKAVINRENEEKESDNDEINKEQKA